MKRFVAILVALAAATVGTLAVASPAQAGPRQEHYAIMIKDGPNHDYWYWIDQMEGIIGCAKCFYLLQFLVPEENPHWQGGIMAGLDQLSQASVAPDERTRAALRAGALDSFTEAARGLGRSSIQPGTAAAWDPDTRRAVPLEAEWLVAAQQDIADGLGALQRGFYDPEPTPWRQVAADKFDEAFTELSTKKAIG